LHSGNYRKISAELIRLRQSEDKVSRKGTLSFFNAMEMVKYKQVIGNAK
jgi:hypothetical protein